MKLKDIINKSVLIIGLTGMMLTGCTSTVEGTVVKEFEGRKNGFLVGGTIALHVYAVETKNKDYNLCAFQSEHDPFDVGDCVKLKLGSNLGNYPLYVGGKLVTDDVYEILEYKNCKE